MGRLLPLILLGLVLPPALPGVAATAAGDLAFREGRSLPAADPPQLLARERGSSHRSGGHRSGGERRVRTGMGGRQAGFDRGNRRPEGGWSRRIGEGSRAQRDFDRARGDLSRRARVDRDDWNRAGERLRREADRIDRDSVRRNFERVENRWDRNRDRVVDNWRDEVRDVWRDDVREDWRRAAGRTRDRIERWDDRWPGWVRPGWALARPWTTGWYGGWSRPPWSWWGSRSLAWGVGSLATAAVINAAVSEAIDASRSAIVVPDSGYALDVSSIEPVGDDAVRFKASTGSTGFEATAQCRRGELNGREPASAAQAQLINAVCQVAYGS